MRDKDALDVLRLLRAVDTTELAHRLSALATAELSADVTSEASRLLPELFGTGENAGVAMAVRAAGVAEDPATLAASFVALVGDLLAAMNGEPEV